MFRIDENRIYLTRGDTAYLQVNVAHEDGVPYTLHDGDTITLSVKKTIDSDEYAFQKVVPAQEVILIEPQDTKELPYGKYYYDIQLTTTLGEIFTIVEKSAFNLKEEVTE